MKRRILLAGAMIGVGALIVVLALSTRAVNTALALNRTFDKSPTGFTIDYPDEWEYIIPSLGIMVLGPPETLFENQPGPTFTIHRAEPLSVVGSLENALDRYLNSGPLRTPERWEITIATRATQIDQRDALLVELQGADRENAPTLHTRIIVTSADNTFVYFFITTVPSERSASFDLTFDAMLATVRILE
jgi:hypothetical protein